MVLVDTPDACMETAADDETARDTDDGEHPDQNGPHDEPRMQESRRVPSIRSRRSFGLRTPPLKVP